MADKTPEQQKTYKQAASDYYNQKYETWMPWIEDQYLKWFTSHNKASYATQDTLDKTKVTGVSQVDKLQDGVNGLVSGQVGQGGLAQPVGDALSKEGINRAERGGKDEQGRPLEGQGPLGGYGQSAVDGVKGGAGSVADGAKSADGFYASYIFTSAGFSGKLGTILIGIIQIPITLFGAILMDRSGRRVLLMVSASGTFLGCFLTGISFYLKAQGLFPEWVPTLALSGILVYIGSYSIGMGPVPWVVMSEIFSINMKAIGGSLVTLVSWLGSFAISYSFSFLMDWSSAGTFFMFSTASLITILFVARLVPETKGRTLEEIQESLNSKR